VIFSKRRWGGSRSEEILGPFPKLSFKALRQASHDCRPATRGRCRFRGGFVPWVPFRARRGVLVLLVGRRPPQVREVTFARASRWDDSSSWSDAGTRKNENTAASANGASWNNPPRKRHGPASRGRASCERLGVTPLKLSFGKGPQDLLHFGEPPHLLLGEDHLPSTATSKMPPPPGVRWDSRPNRFLQLSRQTGGLSL